MLIGIRRVLLIAWISAPALAAAQGPLELEGVAVLGEPFGVGQLQFVTKPEVRLDSASGDPVLLHEKNGRVHYPAFSKQPVRGLLRSLLNRPQKMTAWFLFRGQEPLEISIPELGIGPVVVRPTSEITGEPPLLTQWWQAYTSDGPLGGLFSGRDATPPNVRDYLTAMLAHRLRLQPKWADSGPALDDPIGLLLGSEELRIATLRQAFARGGETLPADQPMPPAIRLPVAQAADPPAADPPADGKIESLAAHVPEECFYVRFGSFGNFQWCRNSLMDVGGDLRQLIAARGLDFGLNKRLEQQLILKTTELSKLFGDLLISDVAFIGHDAFLREGASMGMLFEARNSDLLTGNFRRQRKRLLEENPAASEEEVEIGGQIVSYIATPDGAVRSYYAIDGDHHLFTTGRKLVERFYEAGAGTRSLAANSEFRQARAAYPLARTDSVFLFLSTAFMEHLVSPQYQIEIGRRLAASVDLEMLQLARLAATSEGRTAAAIDDLVVGGYLPANFGLRGDGNRAVWPDLAAGLPVDSMRGGRSSFVPVTDTKVEQATAREVEDYRALAQYLADRIQHVEPWVMAIKRSPHEGNRERVAVDLRISPSGEGIYDFLAKYLQGRPPTSQQLDRVPGNVLAVEALVNGRQTFAGLRDCNPLRVFGIEGEDPINRLILTLASFPTDSIVGYVGVAGNGGGLDFLGDFRFGSPDARGFARSSESLWRRQWGPFNVMSFHPRVLDEVMPQLNVVPAERPAHARIRVADLRNTQLAEGIDSFVARRAKAASMGNVHLLDSLIQQLHIPPAECRDVAERLFGAKLVCPVNGKFVLRTPDKPQARWSWQPPTEPTTPASGAGPVYLTDAINWFRRLEGDAVLEGKTVTAHLEILSQPTASTRPTPPEQ